MAYPHGQYGTVKIIPASALRDQQQQQQQQYWYDPTFSQDPHNFSNQPINISYYNRGIGMYNDAYLHEPYGQNAFIDPSSYGDPQQYPYYGGYSYSAYGYQPSSAYPGAYGPYPGSSGAYRPYPQPQPSPPRRSRTAPSRAPRPTVPSGVPTERRRPRGFSADPPDRRILTSYSGPTKKPAPMYRKRREPTSRINNGFQETDFGGSPLDYNSQFTRPYFSEVTPTLRRSRPFYAPSYTTYPPSTMHRKGTTKLDSQKYPLFARVALKVAQLVLGASILGLVLGPMRGSSFHDFVIRTNTEWQGCVVGVVSVFSILTVILLLTCCFANSFHSWRKLDAYVTVFGSFFYLLISCIEAYYAACYPPNGPRINLVCHRAEWIIATILCFITTALYIIDFVLSWMSGVSML